MMKYDPIDQFSQPTAAMQEEFTLLMSLRLDGLLAPDELAKFEDYLRRYPSFARQWREWQQIHARMANAPHMEPPSLFVNQVELRLMQMERRRHLLHGLLLGAFLALLWGALSATVVGLGAFLFVNQGHWLSDVIHNLAFLSSTLTHWSATLRNVWDTLTSSPQMTAVALAYVTFSVVMLSWWVRFLRKTTAQTEALSL